MKAVAASLRASAALRMPGIMASVAAILIAGHTVRFVTFLTARLMHQLVVTATAVLFKK